jgi:glucose/arabinose dehydrogenase
MLKSFTLISALALMLYWPPASRAEPGPFEVSDFLTDLNICITLEFSPDGRLFFLEKNSGMVRVVKDGVLLSEPWAAIEVDGSGERGLLGIAFDPEFAKNHYVYLYYSVPGSTNNRVIRLREKDGKGVETTTVLEIEDFVRATNHNGGDIKFGPDDMLYISVGDGGGAPGRSQDSDNLLGKILRIDPRGTLPIEYKEPSDIFYALGLRNSFRMAWNPENRTLYATENGPIGRDEINRIEAGGNYGWPSEKGLKRNPRYLNPIWDFGIRSVAPTGIVFYPEWGSFPKEFKGNMIVADYNFGRIYRIFLSGKNLEKIEEKDFHVWMEAGFANTQFADITIGPDGAIYLAGFSKIVKIEYPTD